MNASTLLAACQKPARDESRLLSRSGPINKLTKSPTRRFVQRHYANITKRGFWYIGDCICTIMLLLYALFVLVFGMMTERGTGVYFPGYPHNYDTWKSVLLTVCALGAVAGITLGARTGYDIGRKTSSMPEDSTGAAVVGGIVGYIAVILWFGMFLHNM